MSYFKSFVCIRCMHVTYACVCNKYIEKQMYTKAYLTEAYICFKCTIQYI